jgi:dienelactone hydrolase
MKHLSFSFCARLGRPFVPATKKTKRATALALLLAVGLSTAPVMAQDTDSGAALPAALNAPAESQTKNQGKPPCKKYKIAGLHVAVWKPETLPVQGGAPLVIFSHGSGGKNIQSKFIMRALARAGYLVIAPNHKDSTLTGIDLRPDWTFKRASRWSDKTYDSRRQDIAKLLAALHSDPVWDKQIDWTKVALSGHSLGGYTILGLAGAWPSWKIDGIKAVLGLSPYCEPFLENGNLGNIEVPVMYQGGTKDRGITPSIKRDCGAFSKTSPPVYFVEFDRVGHLGWTNFNHNKKKQELINYYCLAFLDKYLKGISEVNLQTKLEGVTELEAK